MVDKMATQPNPLVSVREYLEMLEKSEVKYEYWDGEVVAMAGASRRHILISGNIYANLWQKLKGSGCRPMGGDQLIRRKGVNRYVFADVVVECKDAQIEPGAVEALNDPVVVFEVLSPSTELMDRKT
jgi:Uma2 family endonuclease